MAEDPSGGSRFQRPKAYDPAFAAERSLPFNAPARSTLDATRRASMHMKDFGFEDDGFSQATNGGKTLQEEATEGGKTLQERCRELTDELAEVKSQLKESQEALSGAKANEDRATQKLQSFLQVNRSQTTLMKAELQKTRRKLTHMQSVASYLREQVEWMSGNLGQPLPGHLQGLPTEAEACAADQELLQLHQRWEQDIMQLQSTLLQSPSRCDRSPSPAATDDSDADCMKKQVTELEATSREQKKEIQRLKALSVLKDGDGLQSDERPGNVDALREELEASNERVKDQQKKLKQLATAYKKLEQEKSSSGPAGCSVSPQKLHSLQSAIAGSRSELISLRQQVNNGLQSQLPSMLREAVAAKLPELQAAMAKGSKEWQDKYAVECDRRRKLHNLLQELKGNIRVYCRVRPLSAHEPASCISFPGPDEIQIVNDDTGTKKTWQFNEVFRQNSTQAQIFEGIRELVCSMIDGFNVCIFAYGQTGSGKTFSMQGSKENPGIYDRTFNELFKVVSERHGWKISLKGALIEVYNEEIRDLLADPNDQRRQKLVVKQGKDGNCVPGLTQRPVANAAEVDELLTTGSRNRTVAATDMNTHSSRSHLLVQIQGSFVSPEGKEIVSTITLVDLAGSERLAKSGVSGDRAKEAIAINKSLSALGDVINARAAKNSHTPFRNSVLTHLLQDSLSGDSKTLMLLQLNPCVEHVDESMCSLQFGARVNNVEMKK